MADTPPEVSLFERCYRAADDQREKDIQTMNPLTGGTLDRPWWYYDRMYRGYSYDLVPEMATWCSRPNKNIGAMAVESYTTMLTDSNPTFTVSQRGEDDKELAELVGKGVEYWWEREYMPMKVALAVKASRIFGIGWLHTYWDEKGAHARFVHPESVLVDADTTVDDYDPAYVIYEQRMQWGDLKKKYGKEAELNEGFDPGYRVGVDVTRVQYDRYTQNYNPATSVSVYQLWYKDPERIVWDDDKDVPGYRVTKSKKKYPRGRVITIAGGKVMEDKENPHKHGEIPFTPIHAYPIPGRFYGVGDIANVMNLWIIRNRFAQHIVDQTFKAGGAILFHGQGADLSGGITNAPIQMVPVRDVNQIRMEKWPQPSRHIIEFMKGVLDTDMMDMVGLHEVSQGAKTPGNPVTAQEISVLAESDRTRARMAARWLNWALERVGRQVISMWAQHGGFEWMIPLTGKVYDEELGEEKTVTLQVPFKADELKGTKLWENLKVGDSSTLPASKQAELQQVQMLMQMGVITPLHVLKYGLVDIPHAKEILADIEGEQAAAAQQPPPMDPTMQGAPPMDPNMMPQQGLPPEALPMTEAPPQPDPAMMAAMQPPAGGDVQQLMAIAEQVAAEQGLNPEDVFAALMGGMNGPQE